MIPFPKEEIRGTLGARFQRVAAAIPDRPVVAAPSGSLTFAELDRASDVVAAAVAARLGPAESPIALLLDRTPDGMIAALGLFKAAKSFLLLSPDFPIQGLKTIWEDAGRPLVITRSDLRRQAEELTGVPDSWLELDRLPESVSPWKGIGARPETTAALIYTSGSTGEPKGVIISHELLLHTTWFNFDRFHINEQDVLALLSPLTGVSLSMAFCAILNGAALRPIAEPIRQLNQLLGILRDEEITVLSLPSVAILRQLPESAEGGIPLPRLRHVQFSGENLKRRDIELFRKVFPRSAEFAHRYGASEAQMIAELRMTSDDEIPWDPIPVGRMVPDKELLLWDENHKPVEPGRTGEIAVRSRYLAGGYWRKPELTRSKFLPDPDGGDRRIYLTGDLGRLLPDGLLEFVGRKDNFVKVRGFSIQLEAVEKALQNAAGVKDAAAAAVRVASGDQRLVAYIVRSGPAGPSVGKLRRELGAVLPPHMIPTVYVFLDSIPRTGNGHVVRAQLPAPGSQRPDLDTPFAEPRTETERRLAAVWREILGLDRVGVQDDFFLLGGDSLLAMNLVLRMEESFGRPVPPEFFTRPTIADLLRHWEGEPLPEPAGAAPASVAALRDWRKRADKKGGFTRRQFRYRSTPLGLGSISLPLYALRTAAEYLTLYLSYEGGCRWLSAWCRRPRVIETFYPAEAGVFRSWMEFLGSRLEGEREVLAANLMTNILWSKKFQARIPFRSEEYFLAALRRASARYFRDLARIIDSPAPGPFARWFAAEGAENVLGSLRSGRGVVLLSFHNASNRYSAASLARLLGIERFPTLSVGYAWRMEYKARSAGGGARRPSGMLASATLDARRQLQNGGIVQIIADLGYDTSDGLPLNVAGRRYLIKPGFAQLALLADAAVVPLYSTRRADGRLVTRFDPPLDAGAGGWSYQARVEHLLAQYGAFLERSWKAAPESLRPQIIDSHLHRPPAAG